MKELVNNMLAEIEVNISEIDLYGYDIVETFLSIVRRLQAVLNDLKTKLQIHSFYKIYRIETQCPDGSNDVIRNYISKELDNLTYFFNRNLDFYQYYRFHSTLYDEYYVVRGKFDLRLCTDSAQFDKDLNFSTLFLRVALTMATWE